MRAEDRRCAYCGTTDNLTTDHKIPRSRGGTDLRENLTLACLPCNVRKKNRTPEEFLEGLPAGTYGPPLPPRRPPPETQAHEVRVIEAWRHL